jgi:hypothetical protein
VGDVYRCLRTHLEETRAGRVWLSAPHRHSQSFPSSQGSPRSSTLTYHYIVRSTVVGELLNGRRYPRTLPSLPAARDSAAV